ncbi:MAG: hypothetical protein ACI4ET_10320 [Bilifractor sp.]
MAVKTIPELPEKTTALVDADLLVVDDGTHSYKIPWRFFKTLLPGVTKMEADQDGNLILTLADGSKVQAKTSDPLKQDKLTFDNAPAANSNNPVTSNGIYTALSEKLDSKEYVNFSGASQTEAGKPGRVPAPDSPNSYLSGAGTWLNDLKNLVVSEFTAQAAAFPVPAAGDTMAVVLGKICKWLTDMLANTGQLTADGTYIKKANTLAQNETALDTALADLGLSVVNGMLCVTYETE